MKNTLNPKWIYIINTLPIVVLLSVFYGEFNIIKSLLPEESISLWKYFGLSLSILGGLNFAYAVYLTIKKKNVSFYYGFIALLCYITFIYLYGYHLNNILPPSIPQWIISDNIIVYVGTFLMPTLIYSLFILVTHFTPENKEYKAWKNLVIGITIPITWYVFSQIILPFWRPVGSQFGTHALLIFIIVGTIFFLFFMLRSVIIIATKKSGLWYKYQLVCKIPISIILPLLGLAVNNGLLFNNFQASNSGIFGDYNSVWFYILSFINGVVICLPNNPNKIYRIILFILRSITFTYTFYFFIVFLPFLPVSIIAIVAVGTGILMLTPLLLFIIHINELSKDFEFLLTYFSPKYIWALSIAGLLVIPTSITIQYIQDKIVVNETLNYVYNPDYSKTYSIHKSSLQKTLDVVKQNKEVNRGGIFGTQIPYLSTYFNWIVLDNLTLSDTKINMIERIFFGKNPTIERSENIQNKSVNISTISNKSVFDKSQNVWKSWIDMEITNKRDNSWRAEYATTINLPEGCWISDYYLYVGDKKEKGILAEKKSAMWVFSNIRNENRDPGILYYLTGNKVAFRIFPFTSNEVRKTGFEIIHKEPFTFHIDGNSLQLGSVEKSEGITFENENAIYISASHKDSLKKITRKPYFHFIVDVSKKENLLNFTNRIENIVEQNKTLSINAKISFTNTYTSTLTLDKNWKTNLQAQNFEGGFYIDRSIKSILFNSYKSKSDTYPIIIVVTDTLQSAIFEKDFSDWKFAFPEKETFYNLTEEGNLEAHSLVSNPSQSTHKIENISYGNSVFEYRFKDNTINYLPDDKQASILLKNDNFHTSETEIKEKNWNSGLSLQAKWRFLILHPETSDENWLDLVKGSFHSQIMTPVTSYLVVENEAQKAVLKRKQKQVLSNNQSLDVGEDAQKMSEPSLIILTILLCVLLWYKHYRKNSIAKTVKV